MLTTKEISERMVRRFCVDDRIPEAKLENGTWLIPSDTPKPKRKPKEKAEDPKENLTAFAKRVVYQRNKNNHYGIYENKKPKQDKKQRFRQNTLPKPLF